MRKYGHRTRRASATMAGAAGRDCWREWSQPVLANAAKHVMATTPFYDNENRQLCVGTVVVKYFRQRLDAQEIILATFQEENWRRSIDDPLTGKNGQDAKQRLRTAVANLNRRQRVLQLHFRVTRQGTAVAWDSLDRSTNTATQERQ